MQNATAFGTVNQTERKSLMSSSGLGVRRSQSTNATASTKAAQSSAITSGRVKLDVSASMIANTRVASAPAPSTVPTVSTRSCRWSELSGTTIAATISAARPKKRLNQKIARQLHRPTSAPPMTGPIARASPETAAQTPTARARARSSV